MIVNGASVTVDAEETASLLDVLRNDLGLASPKFGCGAGECGTCAVIIDGEDRASCMVEVGHVNGCAITTLEGIGTAENPHPLQSAFIELQAGQCGYCVPGLIVGAKALLDRDPSPSRAEIAGALSWHLCRCGVHNRVLDAISRAAQRMREAR
jgi:nicotinate dehydrogenase subunit A